MAKNHIPQERWKRYETGPPAVRMAFTNAETEALPQLLVDIESDWPIMEACVANAHKNYEARHFEDRLRNMAAWYQWIEAYLFGEPITPKKFELPDMRDKPIFIDHLSVLNPPGGKSLSYEAEQIFRMKYLTAIPVLTVNEVRAQFGLSAITA